MLLNEVLKAPYKYKWSKVGKDNLAVFMPTDDKVDPNKVSNGLIMVTFMDYKIDDIDIEDYSAPPELSGKPAVDINFTKGGSIKLTGEGDAFRIMATVLSAIEDYVKKKNVRILTFTAKEKSRRKLYSRLAKMAAKKFGFKVAKNNTSTSPELFALYK